jgi:hypothetical protein
MGIWGSSQGAQLLLQPMSLVPVIYYISMDGGVYRALKHCRHTTCISLMLLVQKMCCYSLLVVIEGKRNKGFCGFGVLDLCTRG